MVLAAEGFETFIRSFQRERVFQLYKKACLVLLNIVKSMFKSGFCLVKAKI